MEIPLCEPAIEDEEVNAVEEVLRSGWLAHGPKNDEFEDVFADYVGVEHAISLNSCTSALHLAIEVNDITGEVIVPSFTFVASANAIVTAGATPVFVDIGRETRNLDPKAVEAAITQDTEAIMVVHYAGLPADMGAIMDIAEDNDLVVIEDTAETIGGTCDGQTAGSFANGCFSFYPTKNITTGEGGMFTTDDDEIAEKVAALIGHGIPSTTFDREDADQPWYRAATQAGYNFRMSNVHAALGVEQMKKIDKLTSTRRDHAAYLTERLQEVSGIEPPVVPEDREHAYQMYTVLTDESIDRNAFVERLTEEGVGASVHFFPPAHEQPRYEDDGYVGGDLTVTEAVSRNIVTLPMFPKLTDEELDYIIETIETAVRTLN